MVYLLETDLENRGESSGRVSSPPYRHWTHGGPSKLSYNFFIDALLETEVV